MNRQPYLESQTYGCVAHAPNKGMCQSVSVHVRSLICLAGHPHGSDVYCWLGSWNSLASMHRGLYYSYCNAPGEKYYVASEWGVIDIHFTCVYNEVRAFFFEAWEPCSLFWLFLNSSVLQSFCGCMLALISVKDLLLRFCSFFWIVNAVYMFYSSIM